MITSTLRTLLKRDEKHFAAWMADRTLPAPSVVKQHIVLSFAVRRRLNTFIETGTYKGDMIEAMRPYFNRLVSIELSRDLHERAVERFRGHRHIELLQGDSGERLAEVRLDGPTLFWLDGHYSGGETAHGAKECPIFEELSAIKNEGHTVLIDDARLFVGGAYPTVAELSDRVSAPLRVENDIIIWEQ